MKLIITLVELSKAIDEKIKNALKSSEFYEVPILSSDLKQPIVRPSLKVFFEECNTEKINSCMRKRTLTVKVYYFATDLEKYKSENLKIQNLIEDEFLTPVKVNDTFSIYVDEVKTKINDDKIPVYSFNLETLEEIPDNIINAGIEYEEIENINLNVESEE